MKIKLLRFTEEPEKICAVAARLCYSSVGIDEIAENFTKKTIKKLLGKIILSKHHSVLEHVSFTFSIEGVSRALLAQLTRHRIASFSVQSQRYVKFRKKLEFVISKTIKKDAYLSEKYSKFLKKSEELYNELLNAGIPPEDARYVLPNASTTMIMLTMNARELRHFFSLRTCNKAQWEIRAMACLMLKIVKKKSPLLFVDAGPNCVREGCHETVTCSKAWKKI
jgi:thymidylate synthase (FAD)